MDLGVMDQGYVIFGGSRGMGRAAAEVLAGEGARVAIIGQDSSRAQAAADELSRSHGNATVGLAVESETSSAAIESVLGKAMDAVGPLRGLAAVAGPMGPQGDLLDLDDEAWDAHFQTQLMLTVRSCRAVLPHLIAQGGGQIVTLAAYSVRAPKANLAPYAAMKSALVNLTKNIAKTYGDRGIRANCVCPGMIDTHALAEAREEAERRFSGNEDDPLYLAAEQDWGMKMALRRVGQPEEVGELIAFLLSERAGYMTGATLNIDGGTDF